MQPPRDEAELLERARRLAGHTLGELGEALGQALPARATRAKGKVGALLEEALGATARSRSVPDFEALGVELKSIPLDRRGRPRESTFVCTVPLGQLEGLDWERSRARGKLRRVLWIPIEAEPSLALTARRIGNPLLWSPSPSEEATLRRDWERIAELVTAGELEAIDAHLGEALQVRPKAARASVRKPAPGPEGGVQWALPRGFYLRRAFTEAILRQAGSAR
ncbi:MAG: DNA mismatch repair endonuclease MutH [Myxococcales bacterium]|nr:DNA mismatch repair endonuclease MutH [Myxococcales bacterium]